MTETYKTKVMEADTKEKKIVVKEEELKEFIFPVEGIKIMSTSMEDAYEKKAILLSKK